MPFKSALLKPVNWFKRRKLWAKISLIFLGVLFLLMFFASSIAKSYINANGKELLGREVHISSLSINYLTFSVSIDDFVMYEENAKDTFVYMQSGYINMDPWRMFDNEYGFSAVEVDHLYCQIIQYDSTFNFSDLSSDEPEDPDADPAKYFLKNVKITNSSFKYIDKTSGNTYPLENLNIDVPELSWNGKESDVDLDFNIGKKGHVAIDMNINNSKNRYSININSKNLDINYGEFYMKDYLQVKELEGLLHTNLNINGSMINSTEIYVKGKTSITELSLLDGLGNKFLSTDSIGLDIDSINVAKDYYHIRTSILKNPIIYASYTKTSSNIDYIIAPLYAEELPDTVVVTPDTSSVVAEVSPFHFGIDEAIIENGTVHYTDKTLDRPFSYAISSMQITAKNITETSRNLPVDFAMNLNGQGRLVGNTTLDMMNGDNISLKAKIENVDMLDLSPLSEYHVGAPMTQGIFNYDLDLEMTSTEMVNHNDFDIRELEFGKKIKSDSAYKVPVKLALVLLKDKDDNIQFEIPVTGNPSDPDFKLFPLIWKTFSKFMVKAAGQPFKAIAGLVGTHPEELEKLPFEYGQDELDDKQKKTLDKVAEIVVKKPELKFSFSQRTNVELEKTGIAVLEAKKIFSPDDWQNISDKDSKFKTYLVTNSGMTEESSIKEMSLKIVESSSLGGKLTQIMAKRNTIVRAYLIEKGVPESAFEISTADMKNLPAEFKTPEFKIEVSSN